KDRLNTHMVQQDKVLRILGHEGNGGRNPLLQPFQGQPALRPVGALLSFRRSGLLLPRAEQRRNETGHVDSPLPCVSRARRARHLNSPAVLSAAQTALWWSPLPKRRQKAAD